MTDLLAPAPAEELIASLNTTMRKMLDEVYRDVEREEERFKQYRHDRHRRFQNETAHMVAQRDALLQALASVEAARPINLKLPA